MLRVAQWGRHMTAATVRRAPGDRVRTISCVSVAAAQQGEKLFDKILVANRGEIACRVIRTARKLGIKTVAVYSDPDAMAMHVKEADEAVCVGPAPSDASYLNIPAILDAIKTTGAQAVHPGYGFLSENSVFAQQLAANNVEFIGPGEFAITKMGDKIESKIIAQNAGVNTIPGYVGVVETDEDVVRISNEIGYPVMIKASAGGGGKGMRIAWDDEEAKVGFRLSKDEARNSFGDDRIFIEKFIEEPRHIEIQLIADKHGNVVALPERECSIQRRNQKVIEESPSMLLDQETRDAMGAQACMLAKAVDYVSAGTVEFLCDKHKNFYFLEMNTRLQVEHPVTEAVSGVDLVEQMIRVAAGHALPTELTSIKGTLPPQGWSFEGRVYAEDAFRGFLPSTGTLSKYTEPPVASTSFVGHGTPELDEEGAGVRVDSGVREGSAISMFYDPMICKLVTYGKTRDEALERLRVSLDKYVIHGLVHNVPFLRDLCDHPRFVSGAITTGFIEEEYPDGFTGVKLTDKEFGNLAATAAIMQTIRIAHNLTIDGNETVAYDIDNSEPLAVTINEQTEEERTYNATVRFGEDSAWVVDLVDGEGNATNVSFDGFDWPVNNLLLHTLRSDETKEVAVQLLDNLPEGFRLQYRGAAHNVAVRSQRRAELAKLMPPKPTIDLSAMLVSPMPGVLVSLAVKEGDVVEIGQELAVVEAMKMANVLRSARQGVVKRIAVAEGATLAVDDIIIEFETEDAEE